MAAAVPIGAVSAADVGAGDGQLARHLAASGVRVIATERLPKPFARLQSALPGLDCRQGEGLEALRPGEVEGAVVAGMGGLRIVRILEGSPEVAHRLRWLVLQPQQHGDRLLGWLGPAGYAVSSRTEAAQAGRSYTVLVVRPHERS